MRFWPTVYAIVCAVAAMVSSGESRGAGPSFQCGATIDPLAQVVCSDPKLSQLELVYVQSYQALRQQVGVDGQAALRTEANAHYLHMVQACGLPRLGPLTAPPANSVPCVSQKLSQARERWLSRLSGVAREEATRPIDRHLALQQALKQAGFLPPDAEIDGNYGPGTRAAIKEWQSAHDQEPNGFLSGQQAAMLTAGVTQTAVPQVPVPQVHVSTGPSWRMRPGIIPLSALTRVPSP